MCRFSGLTQTCQVGKWKGQQQQCGSSKASWWFPCLLKFENHCFPAFFLVSLAGSTIFLKLSLGLSILPEPISNQLASSGEPCVVSLLPSSLSLFSLPVCHPRHLREASKPTETVPLETLHWLHSIQLPYFQALNVSLSST